MLAAAKDEAVFSLAASLFASENSRLGSATSTNELHRAFPFVNSNTATGMDVCLYDDGRGSRSTGKERDAESGLDYFGARYYGSALGRFTSPDEFKGGFENLNGTPAFSPGPIGYADLNDPQTLNMYVYTRNNPLRYVDPDGHDIWDYLLGVGNAFSSDNLGGAGRTSGGNEDFRLGQTVGDAVATITGSIEVLTGGGEAVATSPAALTGVGALVPAAGVAEAAHGATTVAVAGEHLVAAAGKLVQSAKGPGTVPPGERDPKRSATDKEKAQMRAEQKGNCAHCGEPLGDEKGIAHHDPVRHADGGKDMKLTRSDCHKELHGCGS